MSEENRRKSGLTAAWIARAKPKDKPYKLSDRDGLYLLIKPSGTRSWRMPIGHPDPAFVRLPAPENLRLFGRWKQVRPTVALAPTSVT
jgi:hypothetical protein